MRLSYMFLFDLPKFCSFISVQSENSVKQAILGFFFSEVRPSAMQAVLYTEKIIAETSSM